MNKNFIALFLVLIFGLMIVGFVNFSSGNLIGAITGNVVLSENNNLENNGDLKNREIKNILNLDNETFDELTKGNKKIRVIIKTSEPKGIIAKTFVKISQKKVIDESKIKRKLGDIVSIEMSLEELEELENIEILGIDKMMHIFLQDARGIIGAENVWGLNISEVAINGSQTAVCVIDTGVDDTHPDLSGKVIAQYCFCSAYEGGTLNCCPDGTDEDNNATDNNGHGTHVAGIVAASGEINGIAVGANIVAIKVMNSSGTGFSLDIKAAIEWCVDNSSIFNISVISLSLGGGQYENSTSCLVDDGADIQSAINSAVAKNISVVIATGNIYGVYTNATAGISSPACLYNTTKVTASDKSDNYASYAFRHVNFPDILVAPGSDINSTRWTGGYTIESGTSMATPMVAGAIALINQYLSLSGQTKTPSEIEIVLNDTGIVLDDSSGSGYNFSRIDVYSAVLSLDIEAPNITLVSPTNNKINLTNNQTFTCNATDWQLANLTLYVWNSTGLYYNTTDNLTGTANETSFNLTNMSENTYSWNCLVVDSEGNSDFASANYSLTIGGVSVNLLLPSDENYTNTNTTNFSCQVLSDANNELSNVTFYLWNSSGDLNYNLTTNISNFDNTTIFNYTFLTEENYSWNCLGVNNKSNESWSVDNFSVTYDVTFPNLTLISLPSNATSDSISRTFSFNVSDDNMGNCSLIIDGVVNSTNSSMNVSLTQSFSKTFTPGTYPWTINCSDLAGNVNSSVENSFTITAPVVVISSGGGGGGGSSAILTVPQIYEVGVAEISRGYTKSLKNDEKVNFSVFDFEGGRHLLTINEVGVDYVNFIVESDPINLTLGVGQSVKLNLTSAIYYDLFIKVNKIVAGEAELTIQLINEVIEVGVVEVVAEEKIVDVESVIVKDYSSIVIILAIIFIFVGLIILKLNRKKLKTEKPLEKKKKKYGKRKTKA